MVPVETWSPFIGERMFSAGGPDVAVEVEVGIAVVGVEVVAGEVVCVCVGVGVDVVVGAGGVLVVGVGVEAGVEVHPVKAITNDRHKAVKMVEYFTFLNLVTSYNLLVRLYEIQHLVI